MAEKRPQLMWLKFLFSWGKRRQAWGKTRPRTVWLVDYILSLPKSEACEDGSELHLLKSSMMVWSILSIRTFRSWWRLIKSAKYLSCCPYFRLISCLLHSSADIELLLLLLQSDEVDGTNHLPCRSSDSWSSPLAKFVILHAKQTKANIWKYYNETMPILSRSGT